MDLIDFDRRNLATSRDVNVIELLLADEETVLVPVAYDGGGGRSGAVLGLKGVEVVSGSLFRDELFDVFSGMGFKILCDVCALAPAGRRSGS